MADENSILTREVQVAITMTVADRSVLAGLAEWAGLDVDFYVRCLIAEKLLEIGSFCVFEPTSSNDEGLLGTSRSGTAVANCVLESDPAQVRLPQRGLERTRLRGKSGPWDGTFPTRKARK